jgi:phosphate transport system substrate-binding protein
MRKALATVALGLLSLAGSPARAVPVNGAGSSFDEPIFWKWFNTYTNIDSTVDFNYVGLGSSVGVGLMVAEITDFGASDAPMTDKALAEAPGNILNLPVVVGAVAIVYNLEGNPKLRLDADALAGIFLGKIVKWNDLRIAALNPQVALPDQDIAIVHRGDGSGTTFIFTDYLSSVSADWNSEIGKGTSVYWPGGFAGIGSEGLAERVRELPAPLATSSFRTPRKISCPTPTSRIPVGTMFPPPWSRSAPRLRPERFQMISVFPLSTRQGKPPTRSRARAGF